jgi:hypothetical protein
MLSYFVGKRGSSARLANPNGAVEGGQETLGQPVVLLKPPKRLTKYPGRLTGRGDVEVVDDVVKAREMAAYVVATSGQGGEELRFRLV